MATILVVDDSATFREEMKACLTNEGYTVIEAVDGEDGLAKATQNKVDLIISDLNMPNMDGLTMCSHLRAQGNAALVFMLTTQINPSYKAEASRLAVKAWIVKPPNMTALLKGVAKVLSGA